MGRKRHKPEEIIAKLRQVDVLTRRVGKPVWPVCYRKIAALLRHAGWLVNNKRVERIWRRAGLKVPKKQPKRGRLWLGRLGPIYPS